MDDAERAAQGMTVRREVLGDEHVDRAVAGTTPLTAPFQDFITRYAWGEIWSRRCTPEPPRRTARSRSPGRCWRTPLDRAPAPGPATGIVRMTNGCTYRDHMVMMVSGKSRASAASGLAAVVFAAAVFAVRVFAVQGRRIWRG